MISDVLHEAIGEIRRYLDDPAMGKCYQGEIRARIEGLIKEMGQAREVLDLFDTPIMERKPLGPQFRELTIAEAARLYGLESPRYKSTSSKVGRWLREDGFERVRLMGGNVVYRRVEQA